MEAALRQHRTSMEEADDFMATAVKKYSEMRASADAALERAVEAIEQQLAEERVALESKAKHFDEQQQKMKVVSPADDELVELQVSGQHFTATARVLRHHKDSVFHTLISGNFTVARDRNGAIIIDRNPRCFNLILDFLRGDTSNIERLVARKDEQYLPQLISDAKFFGLADLVNICDPPLPPFTHAFMTCGNTGRTGPSLKKCVDTYTSAGASWASDSTKFDIQDGIQQWTVPHSGSYTIEAWGAAGGADTTKNGAGGHGIKLVGKFSLTEGHRINILVGQKGGDAVQGGGGGGGSFVVNRTSNTLLICAGGGAGAICQCYQNFKKSTADATADNDGKTATDGGKGGTDGQGSSSGNFGGGGYKSDGQSSKGGKAYMNGGVGGVNGASENADGGFGGGGGSSCYAGGGGGYSGGGGFCSGSNPAEQSSGGGGSFNSPESRNPWIQRRTRESRYYTLISIVHCSCLLSSNSLSRLSLSLSVSVSLSLSLSLCLHLSLSVSLSLFLFISCLSLFVYLCRSIVLCVSWMTISLLTLSSHKKSPRRKQRYDNTILKYCNTL